MYRLIGKALPTLFHSTFEVGANVGAGHGRYVSEYSDFDGLRTCVATFEGSQPTRMHSWNARSRPANECYQCVNALNLRHAMS